MFQLIEKSKKKLLPWLALLCRLAAHPWATRSNNIGNRERTVISFLTGKKPPEEVVYRKLVKFLLFVTLSVPLSVLYVDEFELLILLSRTRP